MNIESTKFFDKLLDWAFWLERYQYKSLIEQSLADQISLNTFLKNWILLRNSNYSIFNKYKKAYLNGTSLINIKEIPPEVEGFNLLTEKINDVIDEKIFHYTLESRRFHEDPSLLEDTGLVSNYTINQYKSVLKEILPKALSKINKYCK